MIKYYLHSCFLRPRPARARSAWPRRTPGPNTHTQTELIKPILKLFI